MYFTVLKRLDQILLLRVYVEQKKATLGTSFIGHLKYTCTVLKRNNNVSNKAKMDHKRFKLSDLKAQSGALIFTQLFLIINLSCT